MNKGIVLGQVKKVEIVTGFACNNRCLFCSVGNRGEHKKTEEIKKEILKAIEEEKVKEINFTGGEPTIRKDIFDLVSFAKNAGAETVRVTSNGRLFSNDSFTEKIKKAGLSGAIFSIHGSTAKTHDYLCQVKGAFKQAVKGLKNSEKNRLSIDVNTVITTKNLNELPALAEMVSAKYNANFMCLIFPDLAGFILENSDLIPCFEESIEPIEKTIEVMEKNKKGVWLLNVPMCVLKEKRYAASCGELRTKMYWFENKVNLDEHRLKEKIRVKECKKCSIAGKCPGFPEKYIELKGIPKINPVKNNEGKNGMADYI